MFLLEQDDSAGKQRTTVQGPLRDHLGTIFGQIRKLIPRCLGIDLGSILLLEAGLYKVLGAATKCRQPYIKIDISLSFFSTYDGWDATVAARSSGQLPLVAAPSSASSSSSWGWTSSTFQLSNYFGAALQANLVLSISY